MTTLTRLRTLAALGPRNLARVGAYRIGLKSGLHPVLRVTGAAPRGPFFLSVGRPAPDQARPRQAWRAGELMLFGRPLPSPADGGPPDWHANPFDPAARTPADREWWRIPDFSSGAGDVKAVWELSRLDWAVAMAQRAAAGETTELDRLNRWLDDWSARNPPYFGANWKCGQEAAIRVLHLALCALVLGIERDPPEPLRDLVRLHLRRIEPTMGYAVGQANNHGTSEAAALFVGGAWLAAAGDPAGGDWAAAGRRWLENRATALIEPDGTFSQYSTTYQRMVVDTYSLTELGRRRFGLPAFSERCLGRVRAAAEWLRQVTDPEGDTWSLGANDGARLAALTDHDHRDARPTVQLAFALFDEAAAYPPADDLDQPLAWAGLARPSRQAPRLRSRSFDDGGVHVLRRGPVVAYLRYPRFRFRPSQADALHCDLWVGGANLLRDGGAYSYNAAPERIAYFSGAEGHNTVQFDGRDQMPRLGRFLYGDWLAARDVDPVTEAPDGVTAAAAYRDGHGARHRRRLTLTDDRLVCEDAVSGFSARAVLRWRLAPGEWSREGDAFRCGDRRIEIAADPEPVRLSLTEGEESRYYLQKTPLPVIEAEVERPARLTTTVRW